MTREKTVATRPARTTVHVHRRVRDGASIFVRALRDFARGFVGETRLPREREAACCELARRANGRGRCC